MSATYVRLSCGCVVHAEYGDCVCCGCPESTRIDEACPTHDAPLVMAALAHRPAPRPRRWRA